MAHCGAHRCTSGVRAGREWPHHRRYTTVFLALRRFWDGIPVYSENYSFVDPHYLYNPGATMILSPLALVGHVAVARMVFICGNAAAIIAAVAILMRMFGFRLRGWGFPLVVAVAFVTEAVQNTLIFRQY